MGQFHIELPEEKLKAFCRKWEITEFALFGSVLREDFGPNSDIDVLVSFEEDASWDLWDIIRMKEELESIFGRKVDLVEKRAIRNPYRRYEILTTKEIVYAA